MAGLECCKWLTVAFLKYLGAHSFHNSYVLHFLILCKKFKQKCKCTYLKIRDEIFLKWFTESIRAITVSVSNFPFSTQLSSKF